MKQFKPILNFKDVNIINSYRFISGELENVVPTNSYPEWVDNDTNNIPDDWTLLNAVTQVNSGVLSYRNNPGSIGQLIWLDTGKPPGTSYRITLEVEGTIGESFRVSLGNVFDPSGTITISQSGNVKYIIEGVSSGNNRINFQRHITTDSNDIICKYLALQEII